MGLSVKFDDTCTLCVSENMMDKSSPRTSLTAKYQPVRVVSGTSERGHTLELSCHVDFLFRVLAWSTTGARK